MSAGRAPAPVARAAPAPERGRPARPPDDPTIRGVSHIQWTGRPRNPRAHARNAVFYGERRSTAALAAPAPRPAWPSSPPRAGSRRATTSSTRASSAAVRGPGRGRDQRRRPAGHRALDRRLGADDRPQHDLRRRPRPLLARLPGRLTEPQGRTAPRNSRERRVDVRGRKGHLLACRLALPAAAGARRHQTAARSALRPFTDFLTRERTGVPGRPWPRDRRARTERTKTCHPFPTSG